MPPVEWKGGGNVTMWNCRLTVLDSKRKVALFAKNPGWKKTMNARHLDWLQLSPGRYVCLFDTELQPVERLRKLSRRWAQLTLLLDYEDEKNRIKGLAKAKAGQVEHCEIAY
jgi:hypothetical protein